MALAGLQLEAADSWAFARLSGDFNPLHVDAQAARRLQFGGTVCHGVHLVLAALDRAVAAGLLSPACIESVSAVFGASVPTGTPLQLGAGQTVAGPLRLAGSAQGRSLFSAKVVLAAAPLPAGAAPMAHAPEQPATPLNAGFPEAQSLPSGKVALRLNPALAKQLFPALSDQDQGLALIADLVATTHIVGMRCPGLHSIYSEFRLQRQARGPGSSNESGSEGGSDTMAYRVKAADPRFRSVRIEVAGNQWSGTLGAVYRAPPVAQPPLATLCAQVPAGRFAGQRALVVGGSRGLGELAAKILLAGGARVTLTFADGREDGERICAEAVALGRDARAWHLDLAGPLPAQTVRQFAASRFTHLYLFATPKIAKTPTTGWSAALFDRFCNFYVHGLAELVRAVASADDAPALQLLYPSTVFLDAPERGFAEYCAAKAAGETLADHLAQLHGLVLHKPRLPRLQTDQNSSFLGVAGVAPLPILLNLLQAMHSLPATDEAPS